MRLSTTALLVIALAAGCARSHGADDSRPADAGPPGLDSGPSDAGDRGVDAGPNRSDAGPPPADAGVFDCRQIPFALADCLMLTSGTCRDCHYDASRDLWALCPEGLSPPPTMPTGLPTLAECGVSP